MSGPYQGSQNGQAKSQQLAGPPYPPRTAGLGGTPERIPDIPITAVFLLLFAASAVTHLKIFQDNRARGHKFVFSGALFGFCIIRVTTMSLRIAWTCAPDDISLGITAQAFVYVGTIIIFIVNWFFTQRIIRSQHPRWGWSQLYRVVHRVALVCLILSLMLLILAGIQQVYTLNSSILEIDRTVQLTGQTYLAAFCISPIVLVFISLALPRKGTERFGAGRLRNNIVILLIASAVLSAGAIFRCVITWLPPKPARDAHGHRLSGPWYFSKTCFYTFNFTTEIIVVMAYAVTRVDIRFHVANGAKGPGDYKAGLDSRYFDNRARMKEVTKESEVNYNPNAPNEAFPQMQMQHQPGRDSTGSIHECNSNGLDDTGKLVDSWRYPSSLLEIDERTGRYMIREVPRPRSNSYNRRFSQLSSQPTLCGPDRDNHHGNEIPPVPPLPSAMQHSPSAQPSTDWPLSNLHLPNDSVPVLEHCNKRSQSTSGGTGLSNGSHELSEHAMNRVDLINAISYTLGKLDGNDKTGGQKGEKNRSSTFHGAKSPDFEEQIKRSATFGGQSPAPDCDGLTRRSSTFGGRSPAPDYNALKAVERHQSDSAPMEDCPISSPNDIAPPVLSPGGYGLVETHDDNDSDQNEATENDALMGEFDVRPATPTFSMGQETDQHSFDTAQEEFRRFSFEAPPRKGEVGYEGNDSKKSLNDGM